MKKVFLKRLNSLIALLLTLLGYTYSCGPMEYGAPHAKFTVKGKVTSAATDQPIKGIHVSMQWTPTVFTDSLGNYKVTIDDGTRDTVKYQIIFSDVDEDNNGSYKDLDTTVEFINPKYTGGDGEWYEGETSKDFDVKLTPKNNSK